MTDHTQPPAADAVCEGGDLDCGSGLLLIIRSAMSPLAPSGVLEVRSREASVREDLPAWCRMVGHGLVATQPGGGGSTSFFIRKKGEAAERELDVDLQQARDFRWSSRVRWKGGMSATAYARNHAIPVGQPASFDTEDDAPSAVELLLSALGGCLAVGLQWRASRAGIQVQDLEITLSAGSGGVLVYLGVEEDGDPGLGCIQGTAYIRADADSETLQELWRETIRRSPVAATLTRSRELQVELRAV